MNKLIICLLFSMITLVASSQKVYFVYLQSESGQPFFVRMNEKISSSTGSGYIILSKLRDSSYNFSIGFPQNKWAEQNFSLPVAAKDYGYLLKNFGEKGWGLFDLQTLAVRMAISGNTKSETTQKTDSKDVSAFTDILSKAADDPSLKEKQVQPKVEEKKIEPAIQEVAKKNEPEAEVKSAETKKEDIKTVITEPVVTKPAETITPPDVKKEQPKETVTIKPLEEVEKPIVKKEELKMDVKDSLATKPVEIIRQPVVKEEIKNIQSEEYKKSVVTKRSESSTTEGFSLVFFDDNQNGVKDTIRLLIANPKPVIAALKEDAKEEKKFLDIPADTVKKENSREVKKEPVMDTVNSVSQPISTSSKNNCPAIADGSDFQMLRKNMAAAENDDDMLNAASTFFKTKCFSVHQLKNLAALFLNDAGKYKFFDAAYTFVTDAENYPSLQSELKEEYYINRFKAMLRN
jgi:Domain of unknown function (DUF4476)